MPRARKYAALFAAAVILLALWRWPDAAAAAVTAAFGLLLALLGLGQ